VDEQRVGISVVRAWGFRSAGAWCWDKVKVVRLVRLGDSNAEMVTRLISRSTSLRFCIWSERSEFAKR
jgi:hypothetical protein